MDRFKFLNLKASPTERNAELLSFITNPAIIVLIALVLITNHYAPTHEQFWHWLAAGIFLVIIPSAVYVIYTWKKEHRIDIDVTIRRDRIVPMLITSLGAVIGTYLVQHRLDNANLLLLANILSVMLIVLTIVTAVWKISLHAATLATGISMLIIFAGPEYAWLYLIIIAVGWARVTLKQHTVAQVIVGATVGTVVTFVVSALLR